MKKLLFYLSIALFVGLSLHSYTVEAAGSLAMAGFIGAPNLTREEIEDLASQNFSNFSGFATNYTGIGDEFIDFAGSPTQDFSIVDERVFSITITAAASQTGIVYLTPGLGWAPGRIAYTQNNSTKDITATYPLGYVRDGSFKDSTGTYDFTAVGSPNYIEYFYSYIAANPMTLHMIRVSSTSATSIDQQIVVEPQDPFDQDKSKTITPSIYNDENTYKDKVVSIPLVGVSIGADVRIRTTIVAGTTTTYTLFCGNSLHTRKALEKKQGKAAVVLTAKNVTPRSLGSQTRNASRALRG